MFKWLCLLITVAFLAAFLWLINDVRLQVRHSAEVVKQTGEAAQKTSQVIQKAGASVNTHLPAIVKKAEQTSAAMADLADDIRQLKDQLGGIKQKPNQPDLVKPQ